MTMSAPVQQTLAQRAARIRSAMADADVGPLAAASEVVEIVDRWDEYRAEAGGIDAGAWLDRTFGTGRTLAWWQRRHEAVQKLGEASRRTIHHDVAVWVVQSRPQPQWEGIKLALMRARKDNGDNALSMGRARILVEREFGSTARPKRCGACGTKDERITALERAMREAGVAPPE
jgi:hypothetical protein